MASAQETIVKQLLGELSTIAEQNKAGSKASDEDRNMKRSLKTMAKTLTDKTALLVGHDVDGDAIGSIVEDLEAMAELVLPTAEVLWDRKEAEAKITVLTGLGNLGMLTEQNAQDLDAIKEALKVGRSGGERTPQEAIEGRPAQVAISDKDGKVFSTQKGNVQTSVGNIKTRVMAYVKQETNGADVPEAVEQGILEAARLVCTGAQTTAQYGGFTFTAVA